MSRLSVVVLGIAWVGAIFNPMPLKAQSALPEEVEIKLVNSMSDTLATRLNESNCADFNELLDGAQADAEKGSQSGIITQVLEDVKTNPKLRTIVITKLGENAGLQPNSSRCIRRRCSWHSRCGTTEYGLIFTLGGIRLSNLWANLG